MNDALIKTENLIKRYPIGGGEFTALKDINLQFERGEFTGIVGPSGSGKTTLLNILGSLDIPTEGSASVLDKKIEKLSHKEAAQLRNRHMGFIFQTYNLLPVYSVYENIEFPLLLSKVPPAERKQKVLQSLDWVNMMDKINSRPAQLSGGEAQRVSIARAIVKQPEIVLADEPTANLDADNSHNILKLMVDLNKNLKTTFIFATHDEKVIGYLKRKISLVDGRVAKDEVVLQVDN
ncbi:ABC transporter ATP-binding protein [Candidatus Margulisiibacteriota bacterium]